LGGGGNVTTGGDSEKRGGRRTNWSEALDFWITNRIRRGGFEQESAGVGGSSLFGKYPELISSEGREQSLGGGRKKKNKYKEMEKKENKNSSSFEGARKHNYSLG